MTTDHFELIAAKAGANTAVLSDLLGLTKDQAAVIYQDIVQAVVRGGSHWADRHLVFSAETLSELLSVALNVFRTNYAHCGDTEASLAQLDIWLALPASVRILGGYDPPA